MEKAANAAGIGSFLIILDRYIPVFRNCSTGKFLHHLRFLRHSSVFSASLFGILRIFQSCIATTIT